jgi:hypothetical protein
MLKKEIIHNSKLATIEEKGATEFCKTKAFDQAKYFEKPNSMKN